MKYMKFNSDCVYTQYNVWLAEDSFKNNICFSLLFLLHIKIEKLGEIFLKDS